MPQPKQRPGRSGFYISIPVPHDLRRVNGGPCTSNTLHRKAGNTKQEAARNRLGIELEVAEHFKQLRGHDPVGAALQEAPSEDEDFVDTLTRKLREAGLTHAEIDSVLYGREALEEQGLTYIPNPKLEGALAAHTEGIKSWEVWVSERIKIEQPAKTTIRGWNGSLSRFSEWLGTEYLARATKEDAVNYKLLLLDRQQQSTVKTELNRLKAFWNHAKDHGELSVNIWDGLTKKLKGSQKMERVDLDKLEAAKIKADELQDIGFWLQLYTGCRKNEHTGLRYCDIDTDNRTIDFRDYIYGDIERSMKGKNGKDERLIPMHSKIYEKVMQLMPDIATNNSEIPIWPKAYNKREGLYGVSWAVQFTRNYGFTSHQLRGHVVSQLMALNVSPYHLHAITRHSVGGMSEVVKGYVTPTMEELREMVERLN